VDDTTPYLRRLWLKLTPTTPPSTKNKNKVTRPSKSQEQLTAVVCVLRKGLGLVTFFYFIICNFNIIIIIFFLSQFGSPSHDVTTTGSPLRFLLLEIAFSIIME